MKRKNMENAPADVIGRLALDYDPGTLLNACVSHRLKAVTCDDPRFWRSKFEYDFPDVDLASIETKPEYYKLAYFNEYIKRQRRKAWDIKSKVDQDPRIVENKDHIRDLQNEIRRLEDANNQVRAEIFNKSEAILTNLQRFERYIEKLQPKITPSMRIYYDLRTTPDNAGDIFDNIFDYLEDAKGFEKYLLSEGYFNKLKLQPGTLLGVSEVSNAKNAVPNLLVYVYPKDNELHLEFWNSDMDNFSDEMPEFHKLIEAEDWSAADLKRAYDQPFLIGDIDIERAERTKGRRELAEEFNEEDGESEEAEEETE